MSTIPKTLALFEPDDLYPAWRFVDLLEQAAADQLSTRAQNAKVQPKGVIGISIGKTIHEGTRLVVAKSARDAQEVLNREAERFVRANERLWQRDDRPFVHLVIVDISAPVHVTATDQWLWGQWGLLNPKWQVDPGEPWMQRLRAGLDSSRGVHGF